jgi:hypothetical protein
MMKFKMTLAVAALLTIGLSSAAAYADTLTFTLTKSAQETLTTGGSVTYDATVFAPSTNLAPIFLNGDSFNITAPVTLNDNDFFNNFPLSLAPGASFTGDLFVLTAPPGIPYGIYLGTFTLEGGANGNATNTLGTVNFSLAAVPEPSSIVLSLTGTAGLAWAGFRRKLQLRGWAR